MPVGCRCTETHHRRRVVLTGGPGAGKAAQRAIFHVQRELEVIGDTHNAALVLCDRGTVDGLAYWPGPPEEYWSSLETRQEDELARYDAVIHLRTPAAGRGYDHTNPLRTENARLAALIDERLLAAWADHPHRIVVGSESTFLHKATHASRHFTRSCPRAAPPPAHPWPAWGEPNVRGSLALRLSGPLGTYLVAGAGNNTQPSVECPPRSPPRTGPFIPLFHGIM